MCLESAGLVVHDPPLNETRIGWKVFWPLFCDRRYVCPIYDGGTFLPNKWRTDTLKTIGTGVPGVAYRAGYHVFALKKDAEAYLGMGGPFIYNPIRYKVKRVECRGIIAEGVQACTVVEGGIHRYVGLPVFVCKTLRIVEDLPPAGTKKKGTKKKGKGKGK